MPLLWHKMKIGIRRSISPFRKEGKGDLIFLLLRHSDCVTNPFFIKNNVKVEDTVHLSSVFGYLFPILL
jgi:hypothetical protein